MKVTRRILLFTLAYVIISLCIEASLIVFVGLRVPENNAQIAPVILTIPAIIAALVAGYRSPRMLLSISVMTGVLTLAVTLVFIGITGISTGFVEPVINRSIAGFLSALIVSNLLVNKSGKST